MLWHDKEPKTRNPIAKVLIHVWGNASPFPTYPMITVGNVGPFSTGDMHDFFVGLMGKRNIQPGRCGWRYSGRA